LEIWQFSGLIFPVLDSITNKGGKSPKASLVKRRSILKTAATLASVASQLSMKN
jgi:hypothetical protein